MVYTPEEKRKMENVLQAFAQYTASSPDFDMVYSEKVGYVRMITAECADAIYFVIDDFESLVDMFCMDIVADAVQTALHNDPDIENSDMDYDAIRAEIQVYIDRIDEKYRSQAEDIANRHILLDSCDPRLP